MQQNSSILSVWRGYSPGRLGQFLVFPTVCPLYIALLPLGPEEWSLHTVSGTVKLMRGPKEQPEGRRKQGDQVKWGAPECTFQLKTCSQNVGRNLQPKLNTSTAYQRKLSTSSTILRTSFFLSQTTPNYLANGQYIPLSKWQYCRNHKGTASAFKLWWCCQTKASNKSSLISQKKSIYLFIYEVVDDSLWVRVIIATLKSPYFAQP